MHSRRMASKREVQETKGITEYRGISTNHGISAIQGTGIAVDGLLLLQAQRAFGIFEHDLPNHGVRKMVFGEFSLPSLDGQHRPVTSEEHFVLPIRKMKNNCGASA